MRYASYRVSVLTEIFHFLYNLIPLISHHQVYQRGIITPMANIEQLWKDYLDFEKNINPIIAEKMNIERGRDYMNARRVGKDLEAETRGLNRHLPSVPPTGLPEEIKQVQYIVFVSAFVTAIAIMII